MTFLTIRKWGIYHENNSFYFKFQQLLKRGGKYSKVGHDTYHHVKSRSSCIIRVKKSYLLKEIIAKIQLLRSSVRCNKTIFMQENQIILRQKSPNVSSLFICFLALTQNLSNSHCFVCFIQLPNFFLYKEYFTMLPSCY